MFQSAALMKIWHPGFIVLFVIKGHSETFVTFVTSGE
jgi:hypothetical protein